MNTSEFRIGNIVQEGTVVEVKHNYLRVKYKLDNRDRISLIEDAEINPEPISEDWFIKLGFVPHSTNPYWFRKKQVCISVLGFVELIYSDFQLVRLEIKVQHIHHLQNLYQALVGEELVAEPAR